MKEYLVSVIVPVYNVNLYLKQCVDSILSQTYKKLEILLVDDGSTDNSGMICDDYAKIDQRVKVIHKKMVAYPMRVMLRLIYVEVTIFLLWIVMIISHHVFMKF